MGEGKTDLIQERLLSGKRFRSLKNRAPVSLYPLYWKRVAGSTKKKESASMKIASRKEHMRIAKAFAAHPEKTVSASIDFSVMPQLTYP